VYRVLRPGGLFIFGNWELSAYEATAPDRPAFEKLPHLSRALELARSALVYQGIDIRMCHDMPHWLAPESDLWNMTEDSSFVEPMLGFRDVVYAPMLVPIGTWPTEKRLQDVGKIGAHGWAHTWRSTRVSFQVAFGLTAEQSERIVDEAIREVYSPNVQVSVKYHMTYGFKRG
jgi:hypothetical protein